MFNQLGKPEAGETIAIMKTNHGTMKLRLFEELVGECATNFIELAKQGKYDGAPFHRIIKDFMIQGGDPTGTGMGGPGHTIPGEFTANGFKNDLKHTRGVLSMARTMDPNSAGSQFFIMHMDAPHLDGQYAAFGKVIEGIEVVDSIARTPRNMANDKPRQDQRMKKVTVEVSED